MKKNKIVFITRTEQWEWCAIMDLNKKRYKAYGSSEKDAELKLLRLVLFCDAVQQPIMYTNDISHVHYTMPDGTKITEKIK